MNTNATAQMRMSEPEYTGWQVTPRNSEQPQEWTPEYVHDMLECRGYTYKDDGYKAIADAHNAALAAEQERISQAWIKAESDTIQQLRGQLAAANKGWSQEVIRADNAEAAVGENCRTIARLEQQVRELMNELHTANDRLVRMKELLNPLHCDICKKDVPYGCTHVKPNS